MKIIMSPTKQMQKYEYYDYKNKPLFEDKARQVINILKSMDDEELKLIINGSDKIFVQAKQLINNFSFDNDLTPALFSYNGIAFKYLAPEVLDDESLAFLQNHLYILSAVYGILRCFDGIDTYRLEMGSKLKIDGHDLYEFHSHVNKIFEEDDIILNLASKEYSNLITKPKIDVIFYCETNEQLKVKATIAKMARGSMIRYIAENKIDDIEALKDFNLLGFIYDDTLSNKNTLVFVKKG